MVSTVAFAATYSFSGTVGGVTYPACSGGGATWSLNGSTATCTGSISLASGDSILPGSSLTVVANAGITLAGSNTTGSTSVQVSLQTLWGTLQVSGSGSTIYGDLTSSSGAINLINTDVKGSINTSGTVSLDGGTVIGGNVLATSGTVSLSGGSVSGSVHSNCCNVTTANTNVGNGVGSGSSTVTITGGTVSGDITTSGGSGIIIKNATISSGSITATNGSIDISNSTIGSASSPVNVTSSNEVKLQNTTTVYGNATDPIQLAAGTYYINKLNLSDKLTVTGAVQLFIGNKVDLGANGVSLNSGGNAGNLQVNLYGGAEFDAEKNNVSFTGLIYGPGTGTQVKFDNNATITGAIITGGEIKFGNNPTFNYDATVQAQIASIACPVSGGGADHIEIDHTGSALTCQSPSVTVKACANAACSSLYTGGASVTLSPGGAVVNTGATGAVTGTVAQASAGVATLGATVTPYSKRNDMSEYDYQYDKLRYDV